MYCSNCGTQIDLNLAYCPKCGKKRSLFNFNYIFTPKKIVTLSSVGLFLILAVIFINWITNPSASFERNIKNNRYADAMDIYRAKINGNTEEENEITTFLKNYLHSIYRDYKNNSINYKNAKIAIHTVEKTQLVSDETEAIRIDVEQLYNSRQFYKEAELALTKGNLVSAITLYNKVIKDDNNYKTSQTKIKKYRDKYKKNVLNDVDTHIKKKNLREAIYLLNESVGILKDDSDIIEKRLELDEMLKAQAEQEEKRKLLDAQKKQIVIVQHAQIIEQSSEFKSLYPDMMQVIIKNNSQKTIKSFDVGILAYDQNNYPIKIKGNFSYDDGVYEFIGTSEDANIIAGDTSSDDRGFELDKSHDISKIIACVKTVTFYDGSEWENPYYTYWIDRFKERPLTQE